MIVSSHLGFSLSGFLTGLAPVLPFEVFTAMRLAEYCKPTVSYVLNAMDLSVLTGYEHEAWNLGDYVRVEDKELGLSVTTETRFIDLY